MMDRSFRRSMGGWLLAVLLFALTLLPVSALGEAVWDFPLNMADVEEKYLTLANADHPLAATFTPKGLVTLETTKTGANGTTSAGVHMANNSDVQLVNDVSHALIKLSNHAEMDGYTLFIRQGYRSFQEEEKRFERLKDRDQAAQKPGETDYQTGLAVTVVNKAWRSKALTEAFETTEEAQWLMKNCAQYGFVLRYPAGKESVTGWNYEPWHIRFVGEEVAAYMAKENLCLEEFVEQYQAAKAEYVENGGSEDDFTALQTLPEGPILLDEVGADGDHELVLFHD